MTQSTKADAAASAKNRARTKDTARGGSTPSAGQLKRAAEPFAAAGNLVQAGQCERAAPIAAQAPDSDSPIARLQQAARRAREEGDLAQAKKFAQAARNLGGDQDGVMDGILDKLVPSRPG